MYTLSFVVYIIVGTIAVLFAGYNWIYKKEIQRTEKQVGIAIPASFLQLLNALSIVSIIIAGIAIMMIVISLLAK